MDRVRVAAMAEGLRGTWPPVRMAGVDSALRQMGLGQAVEMDCGHGTAREMMDGLARGSGIEPA